MLAALGEAVDALAEDEVVRAVVLGASVRLKPDSSGPPVVGDASWFSLKPALVANVTTCTPPLILRTTCGSRPVDDDPLLSDAASQRRRLIAPRRKDFGR